MADWLDRAQALEQRERSDAIKAQLLKARPTGPSLTHCLDCEEEIPADRQALGGISRCFQCQSAFEMSSRR
jgi:phage/conjugal plasmid C-4 type zinc finger TraR family protein